MQHWANLAQCCILTKMMWNSWTQCVICIHIATVITLLPFTKHLCVLSDDLILCISGLHIVHIFTQLLPFTKQMCISSDDQILYISWIHVEHILTQWLHFTFYKELECALASVLLLGNQGYVLYTYSYYLLLFTKALVCSFRQHYIVYIRDTCWTDDWTLISTEITFYLYK